MNDYQLNIYQPDGPPPPAERLARIMKDVTAVVDDAKAKGVCIYNGGLTAPGSATTVRLRDDELVLTDGPFAESKEHIGGMVIIRVADLDAALEWAGRLSRATTLPIEVRAFAGAH